MMILPAVRDYREFSKFGVIDESSCISVSLIHSDATINVLVVPIKSPYATSY